MAYPFQPPTRPSTSRGPQSRGRPFKLASSGRITNTTSTEGLQVPPRTMESLQAVVPEVHVGGDPAHTAGNNVFKKQPVPPPRQPPMRTARPAGDYRRAYNRHAVCGKMVQTNDMLPTTNNEEEDGQGSFRADDSSAQSSHLPSARLPHPFARHGAAEGFFLASRDAANSDSKEVCNRHAIHGKMVQTMDTLPTINPKEDHCRGSFRLDNSLPLDSYFPSGFPTGGDAAGSNGEEGRPIWLAGAVARNLLALRRPASSLPPPQNPRERVGAAAGPRSPRVRNTPGTSQPPVLRRMRRRRVATWETWQDELEAKEATSAIQAEAHGSSSDEEEEEEFADVGASSSDAQICKGCDFDAEKVLYEAS